MSKRKNLEAAGYTYYDAVFTKDRFIVPAQGVNEHIQNWKDFEEMGFIRVKGGIMEPPRSLKVDMMGLVGVAVVGAAIYGISKFFE